MTRQIIVNERGEYVGHFRPDRAEVFHEARDWDGSHNISRATGSQWDHEALYRSASGRWIICSYSNRQDTPTRYRYADLSEVKEWLLVHGHDEALATYFPDVPEEDGPPNVGGRPAIGGECLVRVGESTRAALRRMAQETGTTVSALIRQAVRECYGLDG